MTTIFDIPTEMRALVLDGTGFEHLQVRQVPTPRPGPGPCRIRKPCTLFNLQFPDAHFIAAGHLHMTAATFGTGAEALLQLHGLFAIEAPALSRRADDFQPRAFRQCPARRRVETKLHRRRIDGADTDGGVSI